MIYDDLKLKPTGYSYCVDDCVWAGEYPVWDWGQGAGKQQLRLFTDFGINYFVDLTENGEMPPYAMLLPAGVGRYSFPIGNGRAPASVESVVEMFRKLEGCIREGLINRLYIHCVGGVGRSGTIVACYYIYFKGMGADEAIKEMQRRYMDHGRSAWISAPETQLQTDFIRLFAERGCEVVRL